MSQKTFHGLFILWFMAAVPGFTAGTVDMVELMRQGDPGQVLSLAFSTASPIPQESSEGTIAVSRKSPRRAALFSAIVPGTGQAYAGNWLKAAAFAGLEIGLWAAYAAYDGDGRDREIAFQQYADTYWSEGRYYAAMAPNAGLPDVTADNYLNYLDELRAYEHETQHHALPETKVQQYYEVIGKYDFFATGWEDYGSAWQGDRVVLTQRRMHYEDMRHESNVSYIRASRCAMVALANHVVSALDAAWTVSRRNATLTVSPQAGMKSMTDTLIPVYGLQVSW